MTARPCLPPGIDRWPTGLETIGHSLAVNAVRFASKLAISHHRGALTYRGLNERANRLAHGLMERGLRQGDHLAVLFGNTPEHVVAIYAAAKIGVVSVVLDPKWVTREILQAIGLFDCTFMVHDASLGGEALHDGLQAAKVRTLAFDGSAPDLAAFDRALEPYPHTEPQAEIADDDVFMIMLTSGTTGLPKGCIKTHKSYVHSCNLSCIGLPIDSDSRELLVVPIYYNSGRASLITQLMIGGTVYLRESFE